MFWINVTNDYSGTLYFVRDMNTKMGGVLNIKESVMFKNNGIRYFPKRIQVLKILPQKEIKTEIAIECFIKENGGRGKFFSLEAMNVETNLLVGGINARRLTQVSDENHKLFLSLSIRGLKILSHHAHYKNLFVKGQASRRIIVRRTQFEVDHS